MGNRPEAYSNTGDGALKAMTPDFSPYCIYLCVIAASPPLLQLEATLLAKTPLYLRKLPGNGECGEMHAPAPLIFRRPVEETGS